MTITTLRPRPLQAMREFLRSERAGGAILIIMALVALLWSNSPGADLYLHLIHAALGPLPLAEWVNDGLMAVFFLLVGLELRREIVSGELSSPARLAAPGIAALGGMIVPAAIYLLLNRHDPAAVRGWGVPVATDIAFALAVLGVLGRRVPIALKVFLTALAIMDDLGAIVIIAVFYTADLHLWLVLAAAAVALGLHVAGRRGVGATWFYLAGGVVLWLLVFRSGIHATIAGVTLAMVVPTPVAERLEHWIQPWVSYLVLPLFGLVNAGLRFDLLPQGAWRDPAGLGVALGLVVGKPIGVFGALTASVRAGLTQRPAGVTTWQLFGAACLCGIGFTMSLFVENLAFRSLQRGDEVKLAIFTGSLISALIGLAILAIASGRSDQKISEPDQDS